MNWVVSLATESFPAPALTLTNGSRLAVLGASTRHTVSLPPSAHTVLLPYIGATITSSPSVPVVVWPSVGPTIVAGRPWQVPASAWAAETSVATSTAASARADRTGGTFFTAGTTRGRTSWFGTSDWGSLKHRPDCVWPDAMVGTGVA